MATLNPDDPNLPIYKEFINRSRPYQKYAHDVPPEIMAELTGRTGAAMAVLVLYVPGQLESDRGGHPEEDRGGA